ncbi:hypothetical protein [Anabaena sp. CCY 0017]|uniref:hypothetical protein n=1 Tax=Anabaena sp. CCY 0017 TaxID=3103866 RepID=UPI0039C6F14D
MESVVMTVVVTETRCSCALNAYSEPKTDRVIAHGKGESKTSNGRITIKAVENRAVHR